MKNYLMHDDFESITKHFMGIDKTEEEIKKLKKLNSELARKNKELNKQNKFVIRKLSGKQTIDRLTRKRSYSEVLDELSESYDFLNKRCLTSLATAEYLFINETEEMDYASVFLGYIKTLEVSLRLLIDISDKKESTLGTLLHELERHKDLNTFARCLDNLEILKTRNKSVHLEAISKHECGKLRKLLLEEGWLERLYFLMENSNKNRIIDIEVDILKKTGIEKIGAAYYNCYSTISGEYLLSKSLLIEGHIEGIARKINYQGFEYYIV